MREFRGPEGEWTIAPGGAVNSEGAHEISRAVNRATRFHRRVVLDFSAVTLADRAAIRLLADIVRHGVELSDCPDYLMHWIANDEYAEAEK